MSIDLKVTECLPDDYQDATLIGRVWEPMVQGPTPVVLRNGRLLSLASIAPTVCALLNLQRPVETIRQADDLLDDESPWLLAPCDLQVLKAAGVTFVASLLERVIEERARGDAERAIALRGAINAALGSDLRAIEPGSAKAAHLKELLIEQGIWSQYLEVAIGPDAEIFTKAPTLSSVGVGAEVGIYSRSTWNNPEPEVVLVVNTAGEVLGATLGNDVNLRDFEGRSALLLSKAKDNNASCAIGPFIRLFDERFDMDAVRSMELRMSVDGEDGFHMEAGSAMSEISRDPLQLVKQTVGKHHQYPDGFVLFLGTMFAPVVDRGEQGRGFTHKIGDVVRIESPLLGTLVNRVNHSEAITPWNFGIMNLMQNLARRGLLDTD
jgi:fumarylacetoacetate (FAA) hydrolase family protein